MRSAAKIAMQGILLSALALLCVSCGSERSVERLDSITGDYLFDGKHFDAIFYTIVYEEDGKLFAFSDLADYPVETQKLKSDPPTYRIKFKTRGDFNLAFSDLENGRYNMLSMTSNDSDFQIDGHRSANNIHKLRDYHDKSRKGYSYKVPLQLGDGLKTGNIIETGIDTTALYSMMNDILENYDYMHSMLIMKDGVLVVEEYFNGWDPVRLHRLQSVTKSYTSTLVGLALEHFHDSDPVGHP